MNKNFLSRIHSSDYSRQRPTYGASQRSNSQTSPSHINTLIKKDQRYLKFPQTKTQTIYHHNNLKQTSETISTFKNFNDRVSQARKQINFQKSQGIKHFLQLSRKIQSQKLLNNRLRQKLEDSYQRNNTITNENCQLNSNRDITMKLRNFHKKNIPHKVASMSQHLLQPQHQSTKSLPKIKYEVKKIQEENQNQVSIRINEEEEKPSEFPSLEESKIEIDNDSPFLDKSDKKMIERLINTEEQKLMMKKKIRKQWKKLPNDFLK